MLIRLNGDYLNRNALKCYVQCQLVINSKYMRKMALNIRHGNGAAIVVRNRESRLHGEGRQVILLIKKWRYAKCKKLKRYYPY